MGYHVKKKTPNLGMGVGHTALVADFRGPSNGVSTLKEEHDNHSTMQSLQQKNVVVKVSHSKTARI